MDCGHRDNYTDIAIICWYENYLGSESMHRHW